MPCWQHIHTRSHSVPTVILRPVATIRTRLLSLVLSLTVLALAVAPVAATSITTDLWVYARGDTVNVSGDGFAASENVELVTTDPFGAEVDRSTVAADPYGNISYSFVLVSDVPGIYDVVATGLSSGLTASTQFDPGTVTYTDLQNGVVWKKNGNSITFAGTFTCENGTPNPRCTSVQSISIEIYQSNAGSGVFNDGPTPSGHRVAVFGPTTPASFPVAGTSSGVAWSATKTIGASPLNLAEGEYEVRVKMTFLDNGTPTPALLNASDALSSNAGGAEFGIDNTAPTIPTHTITPSSTAATYWYNIGTGAPSVAFTCADALSGLASCLLAPTPAAFANGSNQSKTVTAVDNAGNTTSFTWSGISVDMNAPTVTSSVSPTAALQPPAAAANWWNVATGAPTAHFSCADVGSSGLSTCSPDVTFLADGAGQSATGTAVDVAGNSASTTVTVNVDRTRPSSSISTFSGSAAGVSASGSASDSGGSGLSSGSPKPVHVEIHSTSCSGPAFAGSADDLNATSGNWAYTAPSFPTAPGTYYVVSQGTDVAGNAESNIVPSVNCVSYSVAANTAPTISDITDKSTNEDTSTGAIAFTVGDAETAAGSLTVSGSSSNTTLVPNANITFGGSGSSRTVSIVPAANQFGTTTITISVSDGSLSASDTFVLTVNAVNDAPVADDETVLGTEDTTFDTLVSILLTGDTDVDGDTL
ncbi:MAG: hypothetical protein H0W81_12935, partial [Chloroflexi bacterium]|nr:hypothetical protein [Chloroflexota bacterium]